MERTLPPRDQSDLSHSKDQLVYPTSLSVTARLVTRNLEDGGALKKNPTRNTVFGAVSSVSNLTTEGTIFEKKKVKNKKMKKKKKKRNPKTK